MIKKHTVAAFAMALALGIVALAQTAPKSVTLKVNGMTCGGCAKSIEKALMKTDGVLDARVSHPKREAVVSYDDQKVTVDKIKAVIVDTGYTVVDDGDAGSGR